MAPALTETSSGQSQKFALTMNPSLPGIAKIARNHTPSTSCLLVDEENHSKISSNNNNLSKICVESKQARRRRVNGRGPSQLHAYLGRQRQLGPTPQAIRKRSNCYGVLKGEEEVDLKQRLATPTVNGKREPPNNNNIIKELKIEEKGAEGSRISVSNNSSNSKAQSCTMNGKTEVADEDKCTHSDLERNNKTMGTLKANAAGIVLNTNSNGSKDLNNHHIHDPISIKEKVTDTSSNSVNEKVRDKETKVKDLDKETKIKDSDKVPIHQHFPISKMESMSGPGPPPQPSPHLNLSNVLNLNSLSTDASVPRSLPNHRSNATPSPPDPVKCQQMITEKTETRFKFQCDLEKKTDNLLRRVYKLQTNHTAQHMSRQMMELVGVMRKNLQLPPRTDKPSLLRMKLMSSSPVTANNSSFVDIKERFLQNEDVKNLSTAALVNLVKKLECNNEMRTGNSFTNTSRQFLQQSASPLQASNCLRRYSVPRATSLSGSTAATNTASALVATNNETASPLKLDSKLSEDLEWTSGNLITNIHHIEKAIDSDATASSSGGESCDEMDEVEDKRAKSIPFYKRAAWKWAVDRAGVISRWTWLQAQVSDLEYRIRQTSEINKQLRALKQPILDEKAIACCNNAGEESSQVNGFVSSAKQEQNLAGCSRTCALRKIQKRKLVRSRDLPHISKKAARLCNTRCTCTRYTRICNVCCGRVNHVQPMISENMDLSERMGYLDPSFHPVLSFKQDIPLSYHFEAVLSGCDHLRLGGKQRKSRTASHINDHARKQCRKLKKNATATLTGRLRKNITTKRVAANRRRNAGHSRLRKSLNNRHRNASDSSGFSSKAGSPVPSPGGIDNSSQASGNSSGWSNDKDFNKKGSQNLFQDLKRKRGESAFDIDNIVIPYCMAASTRVEKLQYKEIITPKWREIEYEFTDCNSLAVSKEELEEDMSEEVSVKRHDKCEQHEKKRFMNFKVHPLTGRRTRSTRSDSRTDSGANTPDPLSPHNIAEHHDFATVTPPSTPATPGLASVDEIQVHFVSTAASSSSSRRRTTSLSKRDRMNDDFRVPTPDLFIEPVPPWDTRTFPLSDETYEKMLLESVVQEPSVDPVTEESRNEESEHYKAEWNENGTALDAEVAIPPEPCDDPDWVPKSKNTENEAKSPRHSIVLRLAKR